MKILAMYLPQFHRIKENDIWWGEGYTEWTAVRNSKKISRHHHQPKEPLNDNYYDLSNENTETLKWQAQLANEYGIYGFCFYHYWFNGKKILEKPMEILLSNKEIKINFCVCWANETWKKVWYGLDNEVLIKQEYGSSNDWENHFNYLLQFFKDDRYIKINNSPIVNIYRSADIHELDLMLQLWNKLAVENGFNGIYLISANTSGIIDDRKNLFNAYYNFEPGYTLKHNISIFNKFMINANILTRTIYNKVFNKKIVERVINSRIIYNSVYKRHLKIKKPIYLGTFPSWDNTPRRGYKGLIYKNATPKIFEDSLKKIKMNSSSDDFIYINAWNEWGEGCFLEPDKVNNYEYLKVIKSVFKK